MNRKCAFCAVALALALAACGGGSGDAPPLQAADPLAEVPASASRSTAGLVGYLASLVALDAERREPASLEGFTPQSSDDTEPQDVGP
jgi:hypothetical protein